MSRIFRESITRSDVLWVGSLAAVVCILGLSVLWFFSNGSSLSCDKRTDLCTLTYDYVLSEPEVVQWHLSKTARLYLQQEDFNYSKDTYSKTSESPVTSRYRVVFILSDNSRIPFLQMYTGGTERQNTLMKDFQAYLQSTPTTPKYRNRFTEEYHSRLVELGGTVAILISFGILWYGLIRE